MDKEMVEIIRDMVASGGTSAVWIVALIQLTGLIKVAIGWTAVAIIGKSLLAAIRNTKVSS